MPSRPLEAIPRKDIEKYVDLGLRHRSPNVEPYEYLRHWLWVSRQFGYATHDDSWGEFEKEFAIMTRRLVVAERKLQELGVKIEEL